MGTIRSKEIVLEIDIKDNLVSLMKACSNHSVGLFEYLDKDRKKHIFVLQDKQRSHSSNKEQCENSLN